MQKVEIINPYNIEQLESLNDFCLHNNLQNIAKSLKDSIVNKPLNDYLTDQVISPLISEYLVTINNDKITDCCHLFGEKDTKRCFLTFPLITTKKIAKRHLVNSAISYAFDLLDMEEVFVNTSDDNLKINLESLGFTSLGSDENATSYVLGKEELDKSKVY